jgi:phosphoribosylaminoimidazolecarboxamide formyltransferase/IMP cyclohydrolase
MNAIASSSSKSCIAPEITAEARAVLAAKQNLRVLELPLARVAGAARTKRVGGGLLVQTPDDAQRPGRPQGGDQGAPTDARK